VNSSNEVDIQALTYGWRIGRVYGYDKIVPIIPSILFDKKDNHIGQVLSSKTKIINDGYSEVMTYVFRDKGEYKFLLLLLIKSF